MTPGAARGYLGAVDFWSVIRFLHLVGAVVWVGGQIALVVIVRQALNRSIEDPDRRREVLMAAGERYGRVGLLVIMPLLLSTGIALAYYWGVINAKASISVWMTTLTVKIVFAVASFVLAGIHGFVAARSTPGASRALGIFGTVVSLAVLLLAAALV